MKTHAAKRHLHVVTAHVCSPPTFVPFWVDRDRWTCECGQEWLGAGQNAWITADWLKGRMHLAPRELAHA